MSGQAYAAIAALAVALVGLWLMWSPIDSPILECVDVGSARPSRDSIAQPVSGSDSVVSPSPMESRRDEVVAVEPEQRKVSAPSRLQANPAKADKRVLHGRVVDLETNQPIADASIAPWGAREFTFARSDSDGAFELAFELDAIESIEVKKAGYVGTIRFRSEPQGWLDGTAVFVMGLLRECVLEGSVTRSDGIPVVGAAVVCEQNVVSWRPVAPAEQRPPMELPPGLCVVHISGETTAMTDAKGQYQIHGRCPWAMSDPVSLRFEKIHVCRDEILFGRPGETHRLDWIVPIEPGSIRGRVTVNGMPANADVSWRARIDGSADTRTSTADRDFEFEGVPPGPVELVIELGEGFETYIERAVISPGVTARHDVNIALELHRIRGNVRLVELRESSPIAETLGQTGYMSFVYRDATGVRIFAKRDNDGIEVETRSASDGSFVLSLPDATWQSWTVNAEQAPFDKSIEPFHTRSGATAVRLLGIFEGSSR